MADALLEAYRTGTPDAMERHYRYTWHRRAWRAMRTYVQLDLGKRSIGPGDDVDITPDDARHLVAVEHGFRNWAELQAFTQSGTGGASCSGETGAARRSRRERRMGHRRELARVGRNHPAAGAAPVSGPQRRRADDRRVLKEVARVETITALGLSGCREVTDDGVRHLARLPALQHLDLSGTSITDAGLSVLASLPQLRTILARLDPRDRRGRRCPRTLPCARAGESGRNRRR